MSRRIEESRESVKDTINKNVPDAKFQSNQQVVDSASVVSNAGASSFVPVKKEIKGNQLKQDIVSSIVRNTGMSGSANSGDGSSFSGRPVSGEGSAVVSAANSTPSADQRRSDSRLGKKLDRNTTKLNFIPNDQYLVEFTESKPLAEAADNDQGYNGTYRNEQARLQKTSGAVPGDLLFDRDVQLISRDELYFGQGQQVRPAAAVQLEDAITTTVTGTTGSGDPTYGQYDVRQNGNFLTTDAHITLAPDGSVVQMYFDEYDYTPEVVDTVANKSSVSRTILRNDAEIVREIMDTKAGDEKAEIWSPLPRAIRQPTQMVGFLRDVEAEVGNEVLTAYRKASASFAFQLNRAHLDGLDVVNPAITYMSGLNRNYVSLAYQKEQQGENIGAAILPADGNELYGTGPASLLIAAYDSKTKYTTKADFLTQPRGLRMHLQTADNNIDALHADKAFVQAFTSREAFASIDHAFDGTLPVCLTDKAGVIHKISWNDIAAFTTVHSQVRGTTAGSNLSNQVEIVSAIQATIIAGTTVTLAFKYKNDGHADLVAGDLYFDSNVIKCKAAATNGVPFMVYVGDAPALDREVYNVSEYTITANTPVVIDSVNMAAPELGAPVRMYRPHCGPLRYAYSDLRNNYYVDVKHYLFSGLEAYFKDSIGAKMYRILPPDHTLNIKTVHSTMYASLWSFLLCAATPYIQKERINSMRDVLYYEKNVEYPFGTTLIPVREATTKAYVNMNFADYDHELVVAQMQPSLAVTWIMPEMFQRLATNGGSSKLMCPWYSNQEDGYFIDPELRDDAAMSYPSTRSGVRSSLLDCYYSMSEKDLRLCLDMVSFFGSLSNGAENAGAYKYGITTDGQMIVQDVSSSVLSAHDWISLPRNIGRYLVAPYGVLTPTYDGTYSTGNATNDLAGTTSYVIRYWTGRGGLRHNSADNEQSINARVAMNISRASNFVQEWYAILANGMIPPTDAGFVCSLNAINTNNQGMRIFKPFVGDDNASLADAIDTTFISLQKAMWARIQKLPFAVSPFDGVHSSLLANSAAMFDPYDMLYWFGLAGFRASDYRESVYNREKEIVNQGMLFVKDPWMSASPIFKEGSEASGVYSSNSFN